MKRLAAILLMGIFFFNWYGYRLLSSYLENRADRQLEASLDEDRYDDSQLISIKVSSTRLSYYNSNARFERVDGQVEVDGVQYKYVKRRIFNDSVELLCIPNHTAMKLQTARNQFYQLVNDIQQHSGQGKKAEGHAVTKGFSPTDFDMVSGLAPGACTPTTDDRLPVNTALIPALSSSYHFMVEQPPDVISC